MNALALLGFTVAWICLAVGIVVKDSLVKRIAFYGFWMALAVWLGELISNAT